MVDISSGDKKINITVSTSSNKASVNATPDTAMYYSNKSREWAISDKIVSNEDYSSKYYANESKQNADKSTVNLENLTTNYNEYKTDLENTKNVSVEEIETAKTNAISDITNQETLSVDNVNTAGETQVNLAKEQATIATTQAGIATAKTSEVVESGNSAITAITEQETTSKNNIEAKGAEQIVLIQNEGATQIANVQSTGQTEYNKIVATGIDYKANTDLDNLSEAGEKHFLNKQQITNCLLEVPQRIKLELANGVLTLKAGSVVIVPNGFESDEVTPKFDYVKLPNDAVLQKGTFTSASTNRFIGISADNFGFWAAVSTYTNSGNTQTMNSTSAYAYSTFYNTETNKMYKGNGTAWVEINVSLPIALIENSTSEITSINQIFNGIGYIGSTVWVDKGIKGLIPNGRNEDGTLKNVEVITNKVTITSALYQEGLDLCIFASGNLGANTFNNNQGVYFVDSLSEKPARSGSYSWCFSSQDNRWYQNQGTATWKEFSIIYIGRAFCDSNLTITSARFKQPLTVRDYYDSSNLSGLDMPSNRYIDLTLNASGSAYTAPANGWVAISKYSTGSNQYLHIHDDTGLGWAFHSAANGDNICVSLPVLKNRTFRVSYSVGGKTNYFKFIYAQGEV